MRIVFVSDRHDSHRARFDEFFETLTSEFTSVDLSEINTNSGKKSSAKWNNIDDFNKFLSSKPTLLISGPLDTVSRLFIGGDYLHVGISWATDLMVFAASSNDHLMEITKTVQELDLVFVDNYPCENALVAMGVAEKDIVRAPWGPDFEVPLDNWNSIDKAQGPEGIRKVLFGRTIEPHYEPEVFLEAFSQLAKEFDDVHAILIDSGTHVDHIKELIMKLNLENRITWEKARSTAGFLHLIKEADVFVTTPKTDGTSVSVLQAMDLGVPIVSSETNGSAEWVIAGITGWTFPKGDQLQLLMELKDVLSTSNETKQVITQNARKLVQTRAGWNTSKKRMSVRLESMIEEKSRA